MLRSCQAQWLTPAPSGLPAPSTAKAGMDAELFRVLSKAVEELGLEWSPPEEPSRSHLDEWFLPGRRQAPQQRPSPFFPEVHDELTRSWRSPYSARLRTSASSALTTVDGAEEKGYERMPQLDESVAAHLCPPTAIGWKAKASHPSKPCRTTSALAGRSYASAGQAASALHSMAVLQVYQAKLLSVVDESEPDPATLRELRSATDLALRATKTTAQAIGRSMASLVVLERHLWLTLAEIKDADRVSFLDAPISPSGLFGPAVKGFAASSWSAGQEEERVESRHGRTAHQKASHEKPLGTSFFSGCRGNCVCCYRVRTSDHATVCCDSGKNKTQTFSKREQFSSSVPHECPASVQPATQVYPTPCHAGRGLAGHPRSVRVGDGDNKTRLFTPIRSKTPALQRRGLHLGAGRERSRSALRGDDAAGKRTILDLRRLNHALMRRPFRMITLKQILSQIRTEDWFCSLDLKDTYFHIQIAPHHRRFLRFAFEGVAYQYTVLPFGLSLAPRTFTKYMDVLFYEVHGSTLSPLRQMGIHILNYLDNWLILAQSEVELLSHRTLILSHLERLGLRVNFAKSALSPSQWISFLGTVLDSAHMRAVIAPERALAFKSDTARPLKVFQRMLGQSVGRDNSVVRFLKGARRLNPPRPLTVPTWDLPTVLRALKGPPFEPLQSSDLRSLSLKTALLLGLASVKRVGDLQALSTSPACLEFGPNDSKVVLKPRHGYVPKVLSTPFRAQVITLSALPPSEEDRELSLLCPVRALRIYFERSAPFTHTEQLFVSFGNRTKGHPVTKQRLSKWIVDAVMLAYSSLDLQCPIGVRAHSTRGIASSWAWSSGVSITEICTAADWATPSTFARFYNLDIPALQARVLSA